jgi:hypothetical protein
MPRCTHNHEYLYSQSWVPRTVVLNSSISVLPCNRVRSCVNLNQSVFQTVPSISVKTCSSNLTFWPWKAFQSLTTITTTEIWCGPLCYEYQLFDNVDKSKFESVNRKPQSRPDDTVWLPTIVLSPHWCPLPSHDMNPGKLWKKKMDGLL